MLWKKSAAIAMAAAVLLFTNAARANAQAPEIDPSKAVIKDPLPTVPTTGPVQLQGAVAVGPQEPPNVTVGPRGTQEFEYRDSVISLPSVLLRQWNPTKEVPPESIISQRFLRTADTTARKLTLKETIYIALRNNPSIQAVALDPLASTESVNLAYGTFDPTLTSQLDVQKSVTPTTSILQTGGASAFVAKTYDWNFGFNKVLALSNGTLGLTFNNTRVLSNSGFSSVNPSYTPNLTLSLSQPLLQNFGWRFATLNVRIAESGQKQAQWNYAQSLMDFVRQVGGLYWAVVRAEQDLEVQRASLRFNQDLVRQNSIAVRVGTLAPIDLQEAQSAQATSEANVFTAEADLQNRRAALRQVVMFNPDQTFLPAEIQPAERPNPSVVPIVDEQKALETAVQYKPSLAGMREAIRGALMQVKFSENQLLPQVNLGTQFGLTATAGKTRCTPLFGSSTVDPNCTTQVANPTPPPTLVDAPGFQLPFGGQYPDALNRLWKFSFYNYAAVLTFQLPLNNSAAKASLAQARIQFEQSRLQYRAALSQAIVEVEGAINNLRANVQRARATQQATYYARQSLRDEQIRFRVGMATTHDLLQFQQTLVQAEGNQVQAEVDLENSKLGLLHAQGTLLDAYQIAFQLQDQVETPWYARF